MPTFKKCRVMFADTETTGFPFKRTQNSFVLAEVWGVVHIASICWMIYDVPIGETHVGEPKLIANNYELINPANIWDLTIDSPDLKRPLINTRGDRIDFTHSPVQRQEIIDNRIEALKINKLDYTTLLRDGLKPEVVYNKLYNDLKKCDIFIAHNAPFDKKGIERGFLRYLHFTKRMWPDNCRVIDTLDEIKWWEEGRKNRVQAIGDKIPKTFWNKCYRNRRQPPIKVADGTIRKRFFDEGGPCVELNEVYYAVFGKVPDLELAHDARGDTTVLKDIVFEIWNFVEHDGMVTIKAKEPLPPWTSCVFWPITNSSGQLNSSGAACRKQPITGGTKKSNKNRRNNTLKQK